jgi:hypothetical protein
LFDNDSAFWFLLHVIEIREIDFTGVASNWITEMESTFGWKII